MLNLWLLEGRTASVTPGVCICCSELLTYHPKKRPLGLPDGVYSKMLPWRAFPFSPPTHFPTLVYSVFRSGLVMCLIITTGCNTQFFAVKSVTANRVQGMCFIKYHCKYYSIFYSWALKTTSEHMKPLCSWHWTTYSWKLPESVRNARIHKMCEAKSPPKQSLTLHMAYSFMFEILLPPLSLNFTYCSMLKALLNLLFSCCILKRWVFNLMYWIANTYFMEWIIVLY